MQSSDREAARGDALRQSGKRPSPRGLGQTEDRGDQRTGVADPDEKDEIDDVESPGDGLGHPRDPQPVQELAEIDESGVENDGQEDSHDIVETLPGILYGPQQRSLRRGVR